MEDTGNSLLASIMAERKEKTEKVKKRDEELKGLRKRRPLLLPPTREQALTVSQCNSVTLIYMYRDIYTYMYILIYSYIRTAQQIMNAQLMHVRRGARKVTRNRNGCGNAVIS